MIIKAIRLEIFQLHLKSLRQVKTAQHRVHWTLGILPHFGAFFWLQVFSTSQAETTPASAPVTQTVRRFNLQNSI